MDLFIPKSVRSIGRLQTIVRVFAAHGFGHFFERMNLGRLIPLPKRWKPEQHIEEAAPSDVGRRVARAFEELGPTFVKLGQILSARPDLVPASIVRELQRLQDHVAPFDHDEARRIVAEDLGKPIEEAFDRFEAVPLASGSIAQAYRARTHGGRDVVVKVKRPGIEPVIELDLHLLTWLADTVERLLPEAEQYHPRALVDEFRKAITRELDYISEAATMSRFAEALADEPDVRVPRVHWELTGPRVLTMDFISGTPLQQVIENGEADFDRRRIAETLARCFFRQYFEIGMFHADPHPGNVFVHAPARVGLVDFGQIGRFSDELTGQLMIVLLAVVKREVGVIVDVLDDLDGLTPQTDRNLLRREIRDLIDKYYGLPLKRFDLHTVFFEITELIRRNHVLLPRDLVLLIKSLTTVGGAALQLAPEFNLFGLLEERTSQLFRQRFRPSRLLKSAGITGWHLAGIMRSLPQQLREAVRRLGRGEWNVNIRHQNLDYLASELDRSGNRLAFSIVIAAIIVSSSMILTTEQESTLLGVPIRFFGLAGYVFAGILGIGLVWAIWRSGKLS